MSTEWIQIVVACIVIVPFVILTGRYLYWRRWDKERRINRLARRGGLNTYYATLYDQAHPANDIRHPGFSVKVP